MTRHPRHDNFKNAIEAENPEDVHFVDGKEIILDISDDIHDSLRSYELVITDFSGLIIDCWEMNMETACVCPDLNDVYSNHLLFDWFYEYLNTIRFKNLFDAISTKLGHNLIVDIHNK